jgi:hypothetical protein
MIKQESQYIDGREFTVRQFPAMKGFPIFARFVKTVGPALAVLQGANPEADVTSVAPAIATALKDLDPDAATALAAEMLSGTSTTSANGAVVLNNPDVINAVFGGNLGLMFKVLAFSAKVNFGDFFSAGGEMIVPGTANTTTTSKA